MRWERKKPHTTLNFFLLLYYSQRKTHNDILESRLVYAVPDRQHRIVDKWCTGNWNYNGLIVSTKGEGGMKVVLKPKAGG